jgi:hypothetical protein
MIGISIGNLIWILIEIMEINKNSDLDSDRRNRIYEKQLFLCVKCRFYSTVPCTVNSLLTFMSILKRISLEK